jgi:hypothetical protein
MIFSFRVSPDKTLRIQDFGRAFPGGWPGGRE